MKSSIVAWVGWLLIAAVTTFYLYGIIEAIVISINYQQRPAGSYSPVLKTMISSIQALLLANTGILLGISIARPNSPVARQLIPRRKSTAIVDGAAAPLEIKEIIQLYALAAYILVLIACVVTWVFRDFEQDSQTIVSVIPEAGQMFIGISLAYLAAIFNVPPPQTLETI